MARRGFFAQLFDWLSRHPIAQVSTHIDRVRQNGRRLVAADAYRLLVATRRNAEQNADHYDFAMFVPDRELSVHASLHLADLSSRQTLFQALDRINGDDPGPLAPSTRPDPAAACRSAGLHDRRIHDPSAGRLVPSDHGVTLQFREFLVLAALAQAPAKPPHRCDVRRVTNAVDGGEARKVQPIQRLILQLLITQPPQVMDHQQLQQQQAINRPPITVGRGLVYRKVLAKQYSRRDLGHRRQRIAESSQLAQRLQGIQDDELNGDGRYTAAPSQQICRKDVFTAFDLALSN